MSEWYYVQNGEQIGPVSGSQLKALAAAGTLGREDLVWNQSLPEWTPAGRIRGLDFAGSGPAAASAPPRAVIAAARVEKDSAVAGAPAPLAEATAGAGVPGALEPVAVAASQEIRYQSAVGESFPVTSRTVDILRQTRPWVRLFSVLMFIGAGIMIIAGLFFMLLGTGGMAGMRGGGAIVGVVMAAVYVGLALLYIFPAMFLWRYASRINDLMRSGRTNDLETAMEAQRSFWRFVGIMALVVIGIYFSVAMIALLIKILHH